MENIQHTVLGHYWREMLMSFNAVVNIVTIVVSMLKQVLNTYLLCWFVGCFFMWRRKIFFRFLLHGSLESVHVIVIDV